MSRPVSAFRTWWNAPAPTQAHPEYTGKGNLAWTEHTWEGERKELGIAQQVVTEFGIQQEAGADWFDRYGIQFACYHPDKSTAADRALAVYNAMLPICGRTSKARGLALTGCTATFVDVEYVGIVDSLPIDGGGRLWKSVCQVWLLSLYPS